MHPDCTAPEEWRPVPGYEGNYEVSSLGRVRRVKTHGRSGKARIGYVFQPKPKSNGYLSVDLTYGPGKKRSVLVSKLVAEAFLGPRPPGKEVNHKDLNRANNVVENLEYITHSENQLHSTRLTRARCGEKNGVAKLTEQDIQEIRSLRKKVRQETVAQLYGIDQTTVSRIQLGGSWKHVS